MNERNDHDVLAVLYGQLMGAAREVSSDHDFHRLVATASTFQRYSPVNRLYLAVQGAERAVANARMWGSVPAIDGQMCRVRPGQRALQVIAPILSTRRVTDQASGIDRIDTIGPPMFRTVPVFYEAQLVAAPVWPIDPPIALSRHDLEDAWQEIARQLYRDGLGVDRVAVLDDPAAAGHTDVVSRRVSVRDRLEPADALRALVRELAATRLLAAVTGQAGTVREAELNVEADAVEIIVARKLGIDSARWKYPAKAPWEDREGRVHDSAERVLVIADRITEQLETALGRDLTTDGFQKVRRREPAPVVPLRSPSAIKPVVDANGVAFVAQLGVAAPANEVIQRHLDRGGLRWEVLARELATVDTARFVEMGGDPTSQAVALAEAGATAGAAADVLVAVGLPTPVIVGALSVHVRNAGGDETPLFDRSELDPVFRTLGIDADSPTLGLAPVAADKWVTAAVPGTSIEAELARSTDPIGDALISAWSGITSLPEQAEPGDDLISHWTSIRTLDLAAPAVPVAQPAQ